LSKISNLIENFVDLVNKVSSVIVFSALGRPKLTTKHTIPRATIKNKGIGFSSKSSRGAMQRELN
jgi:hypothetical protein